MTAPAKPGNPCFFIWDSQVGWSFKLFFYPACSQGAIYTSFKPIVSLRLMLAGAFGCRYFRWYLYGYRGPCL